MKRIFPSVLLEQERPKAFKANLIEER